MRKQWIPGPTFLLPAHSSAKKEGLGTRLQCLLLFFLVEYEKDPFFYYPKAKEADSSPLGKCHSDRVTLCVHL